MQACQCREKGKTHGIKHSPNRDIRRAAAFSGVCLWQIADSLGITDANFSRKLRRELPTDEKEKIMQMKLYDILPIGEENAVSGSEICRVLGVTPRERRAIAARELNEGLLVLYTTERPGGYFKPDVNSQKGREEIRDLEQENLPACVPLARKLKLQMIFCDSAPGRPSLTRRAPLKKFDHLYTHIKRSFYIMVVNHIDNQHFTLRS